MPHFNYGLFGNNFAVFCLILAAILFFLAHVMGDERKERGTRSTAVITTEYDEKGTTRTYYADCDVDGATMRGSSVTYLQSGVHHYAGETVNIEYWWSEEGITGRQLLFRIVDPNMKELSQKSKRYVPFLRVLAIFCIYVAVRIFVSHL